MRLWAVGAATGAAVMVHGLPRVDAGQTFEHAAAAGDSFSQQGKGGHAAGEIPSGTQEGGNQVEPAVFYIS